MSAFMKLNFNKYLIKLSDVFGDFLGGPVVKTPCFPSRGHGFYTCLGN